MIAALKEDARFYFALRHPGRHLHFLNLFILIVRSPGMWILFSHRIGYWYVLSRRQHGWTIGNILLRIFHMACSILCVWRTKSAVSDATRIDGGVFFSDRGNLTIGVQSIGRGTLVHECVTVGLEVTGRGAALPVIEENVWIGPGTLIFGEITIGRGATILPGSVVGRSVPANAVVAGNPARIIGRDFDNRDLRASARTDDDYLATQMPVCV